MERRKVFQKPDPRASDLQVATDFCSPSGWLTDGDLSPLINKRVEYTRTVAADGRGFH